MGGSWRRVIAATIAALAVQLPVPAWSASALQDCRRVPLVDAASGAPVVGPEDVAFHAASGTVFISAYDRSADRPGGLYALPLSRLESGQVEKVDGGAVTFPHGIGLDPARGRLAAVDHHKGDDGRADSRLVVFRLDASGALDRPEVLDDPRLVHGNDVAPDGAGGWLVTVDHGSESSLGRVLEVSLPLARAVVARPGEPEPFADDLAYANGIARLPDGRVVVAETRTAQLTVFTATGLPVRTLTVEGRPDNVAVLSDGGVAVALVTAGLQLMLSRGGWFGVEPPGSLVVAIDVTGSTPPRVLFDDPDGNILRAATSAVAAGDRLVVGSVADSALAVCPLPAEVSR